MLYSVWNPVKNTFSRISILRVAIFLRSISLLSSRSFGLRVESKSFTISKVALEVSLLDLYQTISKLTVYQFCRSLSRWSGGWRTWIGAEGSEFLQHSNQFGSGTLMVFRYLCLHIWMCFKKRCYVKNLWFLEQLTRDVRFLQRLRRIDYSLLIGIQPFRNDDLDMPEAKGQRPATGQSLQSLVSSVKRYGKSQKPCKDHQCRDYPIKIPLMTKVTNYG